jgi:hypothetical protein
VCACIDVAVLSLALIFSRITFALADFTVWSTSPKKLLGGIDFERIPMLDFKNNLRP